MANTTNFNWETPDDTDLVKDGAAAMRTLGNSIDTSFVDLKGGTTGQVLSKASNTDLDYTWVTTDDANAIQNAIVDAKGDLIAATANDTPARLAVGANGETLVADSSTSTGLRYTANFAAGKNEVINGAFNVWQRGTSITVPIANNSYSGPDRFQFSRNGSSSVVTVSRQAFTPGTAPVAGYEGNFFMRFNQTTAGTGGSYNEVITRLEDVTTNAGQIVTFSFWAKADSSRTLGPITINQNFGSGGSSQVGTSVTLNSTSLTTSWARYTGTVTLPSISGKTIGTSSFLEIDMQMFMNTTFTFDTWGWQLEAGSVATAFQTATGILQGELAACQRYLPALSVDGNDVITGQAYSTTQVNVAYVFPVQPRVKPTGITVSSASSFFVRNSTAGFLNCTSVVFQSGGPTSGSFVATVASGLTAGNASNFFGNSPGLILWTGCEL